MSSGINLVRKDASFELPWKGGRRVFQGGIRLVPIVSKNLVVQKHSR